MSIDIDIIMADNPENLHQQLSSIIFTQGFIRFEGQNRNTHSNILKGHYKFYFEPIYQTNRKEDYIMLDILFEENPYQKIIEIPLLSPFILTSGEPFKIIIKDLQILCLLNFRGFRYILII